MFFIVFTSVLFGAICMLLTQLLLLFLYFRSRPVEPTPHHHQYERAKTEENGKLHEKETCLCLNALIAFLYRELKDTPKVRRWVVKKMNIEFDELLTTKTAGRILEQIHVRDYCLGPAFPTLKNVTLMKGASEEAGKVPEECDVAVEIEYNGGFRISVDVDLVFGTTAYVSVCVNKLKGKARLQFTREPYTHWSFTFYEDPEIDFKVESHFEGRVVPQLGSLIVNQLRKTLKKKHTLPNFKLRYMPFFPKPDPPHTEDDVYVMDEKINIGRLNVTVVECSRLPIASSDTRNELYCTISVGVKRINGSFERSFTSEDDSHPWKQEDIIRRLPGEMFHVEINREKSKSVGVTFKAGSHPGEVVLASVLPDTPAGQTELKKGDIVLTVDGVRVSATKHAAKLIKQTKDKFTLKVQRPIQPLDSQPTAAEDKKETSTDVPDRPPDNDYEDFINVSILTELGYATDDNDGTMKNAQSRLQVPDGGSPVLRHRRRLSSSLDYSTLRQVQASQDREERLAQIKALIRESMHPMKKSKSINIGSQQGLMGTPPTSSDMIHIPHDMKPTESDTISLSSVASLLDDTDQSLMYSTTNEPAPEPAPLDDLYETTLVKACQEPSWDEAFTFDIKDSDKYLNLCVWHRVQTHTGDKDILLGYCCIPLVDVALQCLTTLAGEHLELFKLHPPEQRAGASRHLGHSHLYHHSGFENRLCHGDISLFFQHTPSGDRRPSKDEIAAQESKINDMKAKSKAAEERKKAQRRTARPDELNLQPGKLHRFVGTQFSVQTKCDFCTKKIWTKYALQCQVCKLICHKKCSEKTQAHIACDKNKIWHRADQPTPYKYSDIGTSPHGTPTFSRKSPHQSPYPSPTTSPHESSQSSDEEEDDIDMMVRKLNLLKRQLKQLARTEGNKVDDTDAVFMTAAREMGRELYMEMKPEDRKEKLEHMVNKLQKEIDAEADRQLRLAQEVQSAKRPREKATLQDRLTRSEERMQTLAMLMLHYCAGIQHVNETSQVHTPETNSIPIPQGTAKPQANGH